MSRVDPVLTFASEIVLDVNEPSACKLTDVQHLFIRRLLQVGQRSVSLTSIMFSSHDLAVERLRWREIPSTSGAYVDSASLAQVEDEVYALMECQGDHSHQLVPIREVMRQDVHTIVPDFHWHLDSHAQLQHLMHDRRLSIPIANFVYKILTHFDSMPMYIPAPYLYSPLLPT